MGERYAKLFAAQENLYSEGSPVLIAAGALLKDNNTGKVLAQLKFQNIQGKAIKALTVQVCPLDTVGTPLGDPVEHQYLDLNAARDDTFGSKEVVVLPNASTRSYTVAVKDVVFTNNGVWTAPDAPWEPLFSTKPTTLETALGDSELAKQYRVKFGTRCKYTVRREKDLWRCSCGALNHAEENNCHDCGRNANALEHFDLDELKAERDERVAAETKKAAEEKAVAEEARRAAERSKKITKIVVAVLAVVIAAVLLVTQVVIPEKKYKAAEALLAAGDYNGAMEAFAELGNYKDSKKRAKDMKVTQIVEGLLAS